MSEAIRGRAVEYSLVAVYLVLVVCLLATGAEASISDITVETCRGCHTTAAYNHHTRPICKGDSCSLCHKMVKTPFGFAFQDFRNCLLCHPTTVHRMSCTLCHPDRHLSDYAGRGVEMHGLHRDKVVCGVCHMIPKTIALGPSAAACGNLCHGPKPIGSAKEIHGIHSLSFGIEPNRCYWCHGLSVSRPLNPCDLCHTGVSSNAQKAHQEHARQVECSVCHASVAEFPDVRATSRTVVCSRCHEPRGCCNTTVHFVHVLDKAQCYACHGGSNVYASSRERLDCTICHDSTLNPQPPATFDQAHRVHAARGMTCAACHVIPPAASGASWEAYTPCPAPPPRTGP